ncbi:hypothetical protein Deipe_1676 [Deinococcus peraridilitoris DSM 19664]|uniref:Uncharacterized protein n=1 Tax=Deinococcus peraridilitoris (strain DSM 19664 / LMG 22246 / CIP 109416 / KR-200) TaxID=937777 RepID=L0A047_DEIPD|nr:hypothetical protein Deipe_1676 [Deinococcus peraridilitoris DSM 19664]
MLGLIQNLYHLARECGLSIDNTPVCTVRAEVCGSREELTHLADSLFPYGLYAWVTEDMDGDDNPAGRIATWIAQGARVGHTTVAEQPVLRGAEVRDNALVLEYSPTRQRVGRARTPHDPA